VCTTRFFFVAALALAAFGCGRSYKSTVNDRAPDVATNVEGDSK